MITGERVWQARTKAGLSLRALASRVGVSAQAISKYERGLDVPRADVFSRLADALDVRPEFFLRPMIVGEIAMPRLRKPSKRIEQANAILHLYAPHVSIERRRGRLWLVCQWERPGREPYHCEKSACLNASGNSLACRYGALGMGGTCARATANLILWIRDQPRAPISWWHCWCGPNVALAGDDGDALIEALSASDYGDPAKTCCVHCKNPNRRPVDWWHREGDPTGPCCSHNGCVDWEKA